MKKKLAIQVIMVLLLELALACQAHSASREEVARETMYYVSLASAAYLDQDYKKAIPFYEKALALEKKVPTLEKNMWRVVVDNLGMSYGLTGNLKKAKKTFEYGLSNDGQYPNFYYNLACAYAEMNDPDKAILNLRRAFQYKENIIPGEEMPDPATDDSFIPYLKNEKVSAHAGGVEGS